MGTGDGDAVSKIMARKKEEYEREYKCRACA